MSRILDIRRRTLGRQAETLRRTLQSPSGLFESIDELIRNFRTANKEMISSLTRGREAGVPILDRLRRRLRW